MTTAQRDGAPLHVYLAAMLAALFIACLALRCEAAPVATSMAQAPLSVHGLDRADLRQHLELLEDPGRQLTFDQVRSPQLGRQFITLGKESPNFGFTDSAWWARFTLSNPDDRARHVIIRQDYPLIDHIDFWSQGDDGLWQKTSTGDRVPFAQRPIDNRAFLFPVELAPHSEQTFYLRFVTDGSMNIGLFVHSAGDLIELITHEYLAMGVYYGGFIVLLFYNLIMYLTIRERAFAYYLLYALSYGLYMAVHNGLSFQYLWPNNPWLANQSLLILLAMSLLSCLRFTRSILSSKTLAPQADRIAVWMEVCSLAALAVSPFLSYHRLVIPLALLTAVICIHMLVMGFITLMRGSRPARYYTVAFSGLFGGVLVYMLKTFGLMPHNVVTENAFQIGSLIEMVLLSLAIGSRLNELKQKGYVDALTQLHNRRYFNDQVATEFQRAYRRNLPLSLVVLDIDHFKRFNDTEGHVRGDAALKAVAGVLAASLRKPTLPCRYGGEEFVVILPNTSAADVAVVAERIRGEIQRSTASTFGLTVSVGHATLHRANFDSPKDLFVAADLALYSAKAAGRNRVADYRDCESKRKSDRKPVPIPDQGLAPNRSTP